MKTVAIVVFVFALLVGALCLGGLIIWAIWNFLASYFGFKPITYVIAFAISAVLWVAGLMLAPGK